MDQLDQLLTEDQLAAKLGVSNSFLQKDRKRAKTIPFVRVGYLVRYRADAVMAALISTEQGGDATPRQKARTRPAKATARATA